MIKLADVQLAAIMPKLPYAKRIINLTYINEAMERYLIAENEFRIAAFLAQIAHETAELKYMEEIWGPTEAQKRYEGRKDLGNTQAGDGKRYKGRGAFQLTGRANYDRYGQLLKVDLVRNPEIAARPEYAFLIAGLYWRLNGLNGVADADFEADAALGIDDLVMGQDFRDITRKINGGHNGLVDRQKYYRKALEVLIFGSDDPGQPIEAIDEATSAPTSTPTE
jgi:putative chitinase